MTVQCAVCEHRFETMGAAGEHVDCPQCGAENVLINDPAVVLREVPTVEEQRVPENGGLYSGMTAREVQASQAEAAEMLARDRAAVTALPPPPPVHTPEPDPDGESFPPARGTDVHHYVEFDGSAAGHGRVNVSLFVGAYAEAVLDGAPGCEVRIRRRGRSLQLVTSRFVPGGRRVEDSRLVDEHALTLARAPWEMGNGDGANTARLMRAASPETEDES